MKRRAPCIQPDWHRPRTAPPTVEMCTAYGNRAMAESIFQAYENRLVSAGDESISVHVGGAGPPLLLLHGYPQNHATWIKLAGPLAKHFTCVIADLPGYGASSIPKMHPSTRAFPNVEWRRYSWRLWRAWVMPTSVSWGMTGERGWHTEWPWITLQ